MKRCGAGLALWLAILAFSPLSSRAQYRLSDAPAIDGQSGAYYAPNKIVIAIKSQYAPIVPLEKGGIIFTGLKDLDALNQRYGVSLMWPLFPKAKEHGEPAMAGYYSLSFKNGPLLETVLEAYAQLAIIDHVEPVGVHRVCYTPNDPLIGYQWALSTINARQAWDHSRGDSTVPLGIADTGVDWDHPDLDGNMWYNFADPIDGIDNDGNGYIDDLRGWDWVAGESGFPGEDDSLADNDPMDFNGHGSHVAGIAAAETNNNTGVAGLSHSCSIMALRIGWKGADGYGYVSIDYAAAAFYYAANMGARAINCSWGSSNTGGFGTAVNYAVNHGVVIVSAAGNDNNQVASYLCSRSDVISVAATDQADHKASFSSYGAWVDVSAPGVSIYSTFFNDTYATLEGTSMAAPFVTGLVGLIRSAAPALSRAEVQARIISTAVDIDSLNSTYAGKLGSGRINASNAMAGLGAQLEMPIPASPIGGVWINTPHPTFFWIDTSLAISYHLQLDQHLSFTSTDIDDSSLTDTSFVAPDSLIDGYWYWRVSGGSGPLWTDYSNAEQFRLDTHRPNTAVLLTPALGSTTKNRRPFFSWQAVTDVGGSGVVKYYIQVDSDSLFGAPLLIDDSLLITNYTPVSYLPSDGRLFWRVRAADLAGNYALYATSSFIVDNSPPPAPLSFNVTPHNWTANPSFTLTWANPVDPSGIATALYKVGSIPASNYDTSGHFAGTPPAAFTAVSTGPAVIYLWLVDGLGNTSCLQRSLDTIKYDCTPPAGCVASAPSISGHLSFAVSWSSGTDIGSGLAGLFDVRVKDSLIGTWSVWLSSFSGTTATFTGLNNHTYYFEAAARDLAGNLELFAQNAEAQTHIDTSLVEPSFLPGDANGSNTVTGQDVVYLVKFLKGIGLPPPAPILRADANGSCTVTGSDVTYLVRFFKGIGPAPFRGNCTR